MHVLFVFLTCISLSVSVFAEGFSPELQKKAEDAYMQKNYDQAFLILTEIPNLLGVVPLLDSPRNRTRAEIFFDLARIRLAQNDTSRVREILTYVFDLDDGVRGGILDLVEDDAFFETRNRLAQLRKQKRQKDLSETTFLGAAGRSLMLPGWGQFYRGHPKRAFGFIGATAAATVFWFVCDQDYKRAYNSYRATQIGELNVEQREGTSADPLPYQQRFQVAQSKARRANMALGILAGVWLAGVFDHVIVGPAHLEIRVPIY